jgi:hypothetical protein
MTWVSFLKNKSEPFEKFKAFKVLVENEEKNQMFKVGQWIHDP